jgi:glycosidase
LRRLIALRVNTLVLAGSELQLINLDNQRILGFVRKSGSERVLVFANFSEREQIIAANRLWLYGLSHIFVDLLNGGELSWQDLVLEPYGFVCLQPGKSDT